LEVADAGRETAGGAGGGEPIRGTAVADAVAALRHVADAGGGAAHSRALGVVRARGARPGARLRKVADAGGRATRGAAGNEAVGGTGVADAVAALRHVAEAGRGPADRRALGVGRGGGGRTGARRRRSSPPHRRGPPPPGTRRCSSRPRGSSRSTRYTSPRRRRRRPRRDTWCRRR